MCYRKPGPRCSAHAREALQKAKAAYSRNPDTNTYEALRKAEEDFDATPEGQRELSEAMEKLDESSAEYTKLQERLAYGAKSRELALRAIKSEDKGDVGNHDDDPTERLKTLAPAKVDVELAAIYTEQTAALRELETQRFYLKDYEDGNKKYKAGNLSYSSYTDDAVERSRLAVEKAQQKVDELETKMLPYHAEFRRRGGWTRAFLVDNANGHVHKHMECSTCYSSTRFTWLPEYSGKDESQIVDDAGSKACTVCYPDAPVETLNRASRIENPEVRAAREAREQAKAERDAKRIANALTEDGSEAKFSWVETVGSGRKMVRNEHFKTKRAAEQWWVAEALSAASSDYYASNEPRKNVREQVLEAIAKKEQRDVEEVRSTLTRKMLAKARREGMNVDTDLPYIDHI